MKSRFPSLVILLAAGGLAMTARAEVKNTDATGKASSIAANDSSGSPLHAEQGFHLISPRYGAAVVADGNYLYVIGGSSSDGTQLDDIERFDITTGKTESWTKLKTARVHCRAAIYQGKIYVLGGLDGAQAALESSQRGFEETVEVIDIATRNLTQGVPMLVPKASFACAIIKNQLFVTGGTRFDGDDIITTNTTEIFDFTTGKWEKGLPMPTPRETSAVAVSGLLLAPGGHRGANEVANVEVYVPSEKAWHALPKLSKALDTQAIAYSGRNLYVFGLDKFIVYDLKAKTSSLHATGYKPTHYPAAIAQGNKIYVIGGSLNDSNDIHVLIASKNARSRSKKNFGALDDIRVFSLASTP